MGSRFSAAVFLICLGFASSIDAADLYRVEVGSSREARALTGVGADAVLRVNGGYLVLIEPEHLGRLSESGLTYERLASGVDRANLVLGTSHDGTAPAGGELVYREDDVRLYRLEDAARQLKAGEAQLAPLPDHSLRIIFREPAVRPAVKRLTPSAMDLEALIALVNQDSLASYTSQLQAFPNRLTGSLGNQLSRDWLVDQFQAFGYDSVYLDSFVSSVSGIQTNAQNVIAVKPGVTYSDRYVVIGAHRDAVASSPGADDNGSGTAGVLEVARVLKDIPTEMTFIFALFDAEEQGLYGSYHYAGEAAARGDSIVMMLNMDMVGYMGNTNNVKVYFGADTVWAERWKTVADSLSTNLTGVYSGVSAQSDHYPFQQEGYDVVFLIEYNFSSVYHTFRDSTSYMSWPYMRRIVQASLATAYDADATYVPHPAVTFAAIDPVPELVPPADTTTFRVSVVAATGGIVEPGSPTLHYSFDGAWWQTAALTDVGGGQYDVRLPGPICGDMVQFYLSAVEGTTGVTYYDPDSATPWWAGAASTSATLLSDDFETDQGWSVAGYVSGGAWNRGVPEGGGDRGDPPTDYDGSGQCYLTGSGDGDTDVDGGTTTLMSPMFDVSAGSDALISYARWYSNDFGGSPNEDVLSVYVSNDNGSTGVLVEQVGPSGPEVSGDWFTHSFMVSDYVTPSSQMRVWFSAADLGGGSVVEAAVDAFKVTVITCAADYFVITTEHLPEWTAGTAYLQQLQAAGGAGGYEWVDKYGDLAGTGLALLADGTLSGTPAGAGTISFTATCTDAAEATVERVLSVTVNAPIAITTSGLPAGAVTQAYYQILTAEGGTGVRVWSCPDNGLLGSGLTLSSSGVISGTPYATGTFTFDAAVNDAVGSTDVQELSIVVEPQPICGDVDNSHGSPTVSDLTYLVSYLFRQGPVPPRPETADVNGDGSIRISDLTLLVDYLFRDGDSLECW